MEQLYFLRRKSDGKFWYEGIFFSWTASWRKGVAKTKHQWRQHISSEARAPNYQFLKDDVEICSFLEAFHNKTIHNAMEKDIVNLLRAWRYGREIQKNHAMDKQNFEDTTDILDVLMKYDVPFPDELLTR
jgi:hypothetical protein